MAGTDWQTRHPLTTELLQNANQYSFYEAVRLLHGLHKDAPKVGYQGPPERERIRFRPLLSMSFPVSDIAHVHALEQPDGGERYRLDLTFMGLYGASSPLPAFYTEDLIRLEDDDSLIRGFLDLFHHRLISFVFRVWEKYRHTVQYDPAGKDYYSRRLLTLLGAALEHLPHDESLRPGRLLGYAGLLTQHPRSAASLRALLAEHFPEAPVEIEQCKGRWCEISRAERNRLGEANCTLGQDTTLGQAVFDRAGNFGISMGPMDFDAYMEMLPDTDNMSQLRELVDVFNNDCLDYEVTLILRGDQVRRAQLNSRTEAYTRLGWSSWLGESSEQDQTVTFTLRGWKHGRG
ncbi:MAG: type VI secretion system baseplate subunit TssG [Planctomycetes bacterium]|nr:type VI secretion system baseplate subunit TssG [Planctomycetota bacterium]